MNNNDGQVPDFEKVPGSNAEAAGERNLPEEQDFSKSFEAGVPEFGGFGGEVSERNFGIANAENMYYGEAQDGGLETNDGDSENGRDEGIAEAGAILNLIGNIKMTEDRLRKIYEFDADGAKYPAWELAQILDVAVGDKPKESTGGIEMEKSVNAPVDMERTREAEIHAIKAMQNQIRRMLGADEKYSGLSVSRSGVVEQIASENQANGVEADRATNLAEFLQGLASHEERGEEVGSHEERGEEVDLRLEPELESEPGSGPESGSGSGSGSGLNLESKPENGEDKRENGAEAILEEEKVLDERVKQQEKLNPEILRKQM